MKDNEIDYFSRAMSMSSYGSHSRPSHGNNNMRQMTCFRHFRLSLVVVFIFIICVILSAGDDEDNRGRGTERGFRPRNIAKRIDRRPEFGPVNKPRMQSDSVPDEVHHNGHSDPSSRESLHLHKSDSSKKELHMPPGLQNLANVDSGPFQRGIDIPFYWHVPRSGGGTISDILGR